MSIQARWLTAMGRRLWPVGLTGVLLSAAMVVPSGATAASPRTFAAGSTGSERAALRGTPTEVIDAQTQPDAAAQALNTGCADVSKCAWQSDNVVGAYGPPVILGDALYNCSTGAGDIAETAVGVSDQRAETTSLSEKVSLKVSTGIAGIADTSAEFEAFSKQSEGFSTTVTMTSAITVKPGWVGFTATQLLSANVTGSTYITEGINKLIQVKDIDLSFPGYETPQETRANLVRILYNQNTAPMTAADIASRCNAVNDNPTSGLGAAPPARTKVATGSFKLTLCPQLAAGRSGARDAACKTRTVTGAPPPASGDATATLIAGGRTYAAGNDTAGRIRLTMRRAIRPGKYTLRLRAQARPSTEKATYRRTTIVPITIRST